MTHAKINTEYNDYELTCTGFVISGEVHNFDVEFNNLPDSEYPTGFEMEEIEEHCKEALLNSVYSPELTF